MLVLSTVKMAQIPWSTDLNLGFNNHEIFTKPISNSEKHIGADEMILDEDIYDFYKKEKIKKLKRKFNIKEMKDFIALKDKSSSCFEKDDMMGSKFEKKLEIAYGHILCPQAQHLVAHFNWPAPTKLTAPTQLVGCPRRRRGDEDAAAAPHLLSAGHLGLPLPRKEGCGCWIYCPPRRHAVVDADADHHGGQAHGRVPLRGGAGHQPEAAQVSGARGRGARLRAPRRRRNLPRHRHIPQVAPVVVGGGAGAAVPAHELSLEACTHAAQNERLPLRVVVQVLFFEQLRLRTSIAGWFFVSDNAQANGGTRPHPGGAIVPKGSAAAAASPLAQTGADRDFDMPVGKDAGITAARPVAASASHTTS